MLFTLQVGISLPDVRGGTDMKISHSESMSSSRERARYISHISMVSFFLVLVTLYVA
jgi:hypothetical protein